VAFVLDASVTVAWCFADETSSYTEGVLDLLIQEPAIVPVVWPFEVANALWVGERRHRMNAGQVAASLEQLLDLPIVVDDAMFSSAWGPVLSIARQHEFAVYDAVNVELAQRRDIPIATIDDRQRDVAARLGVPLVAVE
jgi:predicted nucleic acid-binding protein